MDFKEQSREAKERSMKLAQAAPDVMKAFGALHDAAAKERALNAKTKELIALALSVAAHCIPCITAHVGAAIRAGVTREEVAEAIEIAVLMGGGPGLSYGAMALEAWDQLSAK